MAFGATATSLLATRESWHRLAEHVLAPARHAVDGRIGLRPAPGGFATPPYGAPPTVVAVEGADVVVVEGGRSRRCTPRTPREAAAFVGVEPGIDTGEYTPATPADPDEPLRIDADAADVLADWYRTGAEALAAFAPEAPATLWPEHFDLAIVLDRVNYGISPGDADIAEPYAYVGPWDAVDDPYFLDHGFGAARTAAEAPAVADVVAFFRTAHAHLGRTS